MRRHSELSVRRSSGTSRSINGALRRTSSHDGLSVVTSTTNTSLSSSRNRRGSHQANNRDNMRRLSIHMSLRRVSVTSLSSGGDSDMDLGQLDEEDMSKTNFPRESLRYLPRILRETFAMRETSRPTMMGRAALAQLDLRLRLRHPRKLPHHRTMRGTVLILDMSGFTALGERLRSELGPLDGAAEFANKVNAILSAMVDQVHRYGGDVILFAGDALVCLFQDREELAEDAERASLLGARDCCLNVLGEVATTSEGNFTVHGGAAHGEVNCFYLGEPSTQPGDCKFCMSGKPLQRAGVLLDDAGKGEVRIDGLGEEGYLTEEEGKRAYLAMKMEDGQKNPKSNIPQDINVCHVEDEQNHVAESGKVPIEHIDDYDVHPYARAYISKLQARRNDNDAVNAMSILDNELRPVAVIFVGLHDLDDIDPLNKGSIQLMNDCFVSLSQITQSCNGAVQNMLMDDKGCIFISVFGATSHELNPCFDAAVCSMRMQSALNDLKLQKFKLGVSFGDCFCGEFGPSNRSDFFVMGAEVNMSARLKGKAPNKGILASDHIYNHAHQDIQFGKTPEKIQVKGKEGAFYAFIPQARVGHRQVEKKAIQGSEQPFITMPSRVYAANTMIQALDSAHAGDPQLIFVCSAPFLGKSRMIEEVCKIGTENDFTKLQSFRTSLDSYTSYFPFRQITSMALQACASRLFKQEFDDDLSAMSELIANKVLNKSDRVVMGSILPSVIDSQLISLLQGQNPTALAKSLVDSFLKIFKQLQPLMLVFEGDGELDSSSWILLSELLKRAQKESIHLLLMVAFRDTPAIPCVASNLKADAIYVNLVPFDQDETETFVKGFLGISDETIRIDKKLLDVVYDRSNGCPTFMEYIVTWALDKQMFEYVDGGQTLALKMIDEHSEDATAAIPSELSNIVLASFNNLSPVLWDALKIASCVGYSFNICVYGELKSLDYMSRIKKLALDYQAFERCSGNRYKWKSQAVFEAVKSLLMTHQRIQIQKMIVNAFEESRKFFENSPMLRDEVHRLLARHCSLAEMWEGAFSQYMQAGKYAESTYKFSEAAQMYEEAIKVQARKSKETVVTDSSTLLPKVKLGNCLRELARYQEAEKLLKSCLTEAEGNMTNGAADEQIFLQALTSLAVLSQAQSNYSSAKELYQKALPIARKIYTSSSSLWMARIIAGYAETLRKSGELPLAETMHQEALTIRNNAAEERLCTELELAVSYTQLGCTQHGMRRYNEAYEQHRSALLSRFKYLDFSHGLVSESLNYCAESLCALGRSNDGIPLAMHAVEIRKVVFGASHPALAHALSVLASCYHKAGRSHDAIGFLEQCLDICEKAFKKNHANLIPNLINYGEVLRATGDCKKAREAYEKAVIIHELNFKEGQKASQLDKCKNEIDKLNRLISSSQDNGGPIPISKVYSPPNELSGIPVVDLHKNGTPIIVLTDIGRDTDDEMTFILLAAMKRMCLLNPIAIVTTLSPQRERAWLARGSLDALGLLDVPVGIGSSGGVEEGKKLEFYGGCYVRQSHSIFEDGVDLMVRALKASPPKSVQFLCIASLTDAATLLRHNTDLFFDRVKEVIVMGGLEPLAASDNIKPDSAYNNNCDMEAANYVYKKCQELGIPTITLSRWAAYGSAVPTSMLDNLASTEHMVASNIRGVSEANITALWKKVNYSNSDPRREKLPPRCNRQWFCQTFTGVSDVDEHEQSIWSKVTRLNIYDPLALLVCVPEFMEIHFKWKTKMVNGTSHILVGESKDETGIIDVEYLHEEVTKLFMAALKSALHLSVSKT